MKRFSFFLSFKNKKMTYIFFLILCIAIGLFYAFKHGNKAKKEIENFEHYKKEIQVNTKNIIQLKYFGQIDLNHTEEYVQVNTIINNKRISLDLNFIQEKVSKQSIQPTIDFLGNLSTIEENAIREIAENFKNGNEVKPYIQHHLQEFSQEEKKSLGITVHKNLEEQMNIFLDSIYLKRIGFYPEEWESMVVFDYTISQELTQYLLVLVFNKDQELVQITTES
jgi:hypothetical protein